MSITTLYQEWRIQPRRGGSGGGNVAGTLSEFVLEGSRPSGMPASNDPHVQPAQLVGVRPTAGVPYSRERAPDRPGIEAVPHRGIVTSSPLPPPTQRYRLSFGGLGPSAGFPVSGTISFSDDPSYGGRLHFINTSGGQGRCAADFRGDGMILDGSFGGARVMTGQVVILNYGHNLFGGVTDLAHRIESAVRTAPSGGAWGALVSFIVPQSAIAFVAGYSSGLAAGVTLYLCEFVVSPQA